jgi:hypothetical protein
LATSQEERNLLKAFGSMSNDILSGTTPNFVRNLMGPPPSMNIAPAPVPQKMSSFTMGQQAGMPANMAIQAATSGARMSAENDARKMVDMEQGSRKNRAKAAAKALIEEFPESLWGVSPLPPYDNAVARYAEEFNVSIKEIEGELSGLAGEAERAKAPTETDKDLPILRGGMGGMGIPSIPPAIRDPLVEAFSAIGRQLPRVAGTSPIIPTPGMNIPPLPMSPEAAQAQLQEYEKLQGWLPPQVEFGMSGRRGIPSIELSRRPPSEAEDEAEVELRLASLGEGPSERMMGGVPPVEPTADTFEPKIVEHDPEWTLGQAAYAMMSEISPYGGVREDDPFMGFPDPSAAAFESAAMGWLGKNANRPEYMAAVKRGQPHSMGSFWLTNIMGAPGTEGGTYYDYLTKGEHINPKHTQRFYDSIVGASGTAYQHDNPMDWAKRSPGERDAHLNDKQVEYIGNLVRDNPELEFGIVAAQEGITGKGYFGNIEFNALKNAWNYYQKALIRDPSAPKIGFAAFYDDKFRPSGKKARSLGTPVPFGSWFDEKRARAMGQTAK